MQVLSSELSLGAENHYVYMFKLLVYNKLNLDTPKNEQLDDKLPQRRLARFDRDLYNKAMSLPEVQTVTLKRLSADSINLSKYQYGKFLGGTVYSTLDGEIDSYNKQVDSQEGWIILDLLSNEYCLFRNEDKSYIIAIKDFTPEPIVEDFMPLFDELNKHSTHFDLDYNISNDTSEKITLDRGDFDDTNKRVPSVKLNETDNRTMSSNYGNSRSGYKLSSSYSEEVIIRDIEGKQFLYCYQTPESIAYTSQATYEPQSTRGTQQPFQFYQGASAISISITLKWHISEIINSEHEDQRTLKSIAEIAESFTRPWDNGNGSIKPKICHVTLPGLSEIGYITQANITYSGSMIGKRRDVSQEELGNYGYNVDYGYDSIEVVFDLLVIKTVDLKRIGSDDSGNTDQSTEQGAAQAPNITLLDGSQGVVSAENPNSSLSTSQERAYSSINDRFTPYV